MGWPEALDAQQTCAALIASTPIIEMLGQAMLPGEDKTRRELRKKFAKDFEIAREVLALAYEVHDTLCPERCRRFSHFTKATCIAGLTKLCNQYRSVHALCELGLTDDAWIVLRAMFETFLRISFLLRRSTTLRRVKGSPSWASNERLSVNKRARLLIADILSRRNKYQDDLTSIPRWRSSAAKLKPITARRLQTAQQHVSQTLIQYLGKRNMCGLSIKDMACGLGLREWYIAFYSQVSLPAHAADFDQLLEIDDANRSIEPRLYPDEETTTLPVKMAGDFLLAALESVDNRWKLGRSASIEALSRRVKDHRWDYRQGIAAGDRPT